MQITIDVPDECLIKDGWEYEPTGEYRVPVANEAILRGSSVFIVRYPASDRHIILRSRRAPDANTALCNPALMAMVSDLLATGRDDDRQTALNLCRAFLPPEFANASIDVELLWVVSDWWEERGNCQVAETLRSLRRQ